MANNKSIEQRISHNFKSSFKNMKLITVNKPRTDKKLIQNQRDDVKSLIKAHNVKFF